MATGNVLPYLNEKPDMLKDRSVRVALLLSVLVHGCLGSYLLHWQPKEATAPPVETKIQVKFASRPQLLPKAVEPEIPRPPAIEPASRTLPAMPTSQPTTEALPTTQQQARGGEVAQEPPIATQGPMQAERVETTPQTSARANSGDAVAAFLARLEQRKEYPYIARKRGQTGTVTVHIRIAPDGALREAAIAVSSGTPRLDEAAIALVRQSCPFRHETGEELRMTVPIVYDLKE